MPEFVMRHPKLPGQPIIVVANDESDLSSGTSPQEASGWRLVGGDDNGPGGYASSTVKELRAEIAARNEGRDEDALIVPAGNKKDDLVAALDADDVKVVESEPAEPVNPENEE